jgi:PIN domain nuclease of toxin-antitoxin system
MQVLLDTHALLWHEQAIEKFSVKAREMLATPGVELTVSYVSIWEIAIKTGIGKLRLNCSVEDFVNSVMAQGLPLLPIQLEHFFSVSKLPHHHRDPFDRLLAAQAIVEGAALLSADPAFDNYGVARCW